MSIATYAALAMPDENRRPARFDVGLGEHQCFVDAQSSTPQHDDQPAYPRSVDPVPGLAHDRDDLFYPGWVGWVADTFVPRCASLPVAGDRRRRPTTPGGAQQLNTHGRSSTDERLTDPVG
jgi:hypothetical protein